MDEDFIAGLKKAASMCRYRETSWRNLESQGGNEMHTQGQCYTRALEAMTCSDMIDTLIREIKDKR